MKKYGWTEPYIPMNVKNSEGKLEKLFADDDYIAELKRDGSRYTVIDGRFFSRKKSEDKKKPETLGLPVEKTANVPHLAEFFSQFPGYVFEGEIFYPKKKSNTVTSIMGCDAWKALMRQEFGEFDHFPAPKAGDPAVLKWRPDENSEWMKVDKDSESFLSMGLGKIHYMLFECTYVEGQDLRDLPWEERREYLEHFYETYVAGTEYEAFIHLSTVFEGESAKRALLKWAEENKEEGIVFKNRHSTYQCDKRPEHHWYRVKGKIYADVVVMGYEPPEKEHKGKASELPGWQYWEDDSGEIHIGSHHGKGFTPVSKFYAMGWIGSVKFGLYKDGELAEAGTCSGMDEEIRQFFTDNQDHLLGRVIEISAMERTDKGKFRHPQFERFRDDKNAEDCLWENEMGGE